ncbi:DNA mismatch repair protein MSH5 [Cladobotryum mycophilum]|uniref:DNA mismatch repair protein MSH5 n=1 Tax=Cladobotryum mycophilum TaxID=491253 RepID=A0ABR0S6C1_9HYPO
MPQVLRSPRLRYTTVSSPLVKDNSKGGRRLQQHADPGRSPAISLATKLTDNLLEEPDSSETADHTNDGLGVHGGGDSFMPEIIMALDMRDGATMGCAFFNTTDGVLAVSEDIPTADVVIAEQFVTYIQPTTLLVSGRAPDYILAYLERRGSPNIEGDQSSMFNLRVLPSSDFSHVSACDRLVSLHNNQWPSTNNRNSQFSTDTETFDECHEGRASRLIKHIRCGSSIDLDSVASISSAGAILAELHRRRSIGLLSTGQIAEMTFRVNSIEMFSLSDYLFINEETLASLQIIQHELHPNSWTWGAVSDRSSVKESLSVYGLFHHLASTPQGRTRLRQIFFRPTLRREIITERHQALSVLLLPENEDKMKQAHSILRKIRNLRPIITNLRKGTNSPSVGQSFDRRLISGISSSVLIPVGEMVNRVIDFDQSKSRQGCYIKAGVNPQLDKLHRQNEGIDSLLSKIVNDVRQKSPEWARRYIRSCMFLPQLGFLILVEQDPRTSGGKYDGGNIEGDVWEKIFTDAGELCYKNRYMMELDHQYGDMYGEVGDMEVEILHQLAKEVLEHEESLVAMSDLCGEFDAILALAIGAQKYGWTLPQMADSSILQIKGGRHPLQELVVPSFVPNDCFMGGEYALSNGQVQKQPRALILTGPNHSGKSIYIKQSAIIVYLAHIGSFVPAEKAIVGITDKILTRISSRESVSRIESAFAIDLKQIAQAMRYATARTLVVIDEFGKGTNADDGAGLFAAVLNHFQSEESSKPRLLLATHFHEVFDGPYLDRNQDLSLCHMKVETDWEAAQDEDQVTYLFELAEGHITSSFGVQCAALNGVSRAVVDRAEAIALLLSRNEDIGSSSAKLSELEEQHLETAETVARRFLQMMFKPQHGVGRSAKGLLRNILASAST